MDLGRLHYTLLYYFSIHGCNGPAAAGLLPSDVVVMRMQCRGQMELGEVLDDICSRFILNLPQEDLASFERLGSRGVIQVTVC
jgi:hypothetical protein